MMTPGTIVKGLGELLLVLVDLQIELIARFELGVEMARRDARLGHAGAVLEVLERAFIEKAAHRLDVLLGAG